MSTGGPLWQQILFLAIVPPVMAFLFAIFARGWAATVAGVLGTRVSDTTRKEQVWEFWFVLWVLYAADVGIFVYAHVFR